MVPLPQIFSPCSDGLKSGLCVSAPHKEHADSEGGGGSKVSLFSDLISCEPGYKTDGGFILPEVYNSAILSNSSLC